MTDYRRGAFVDLTCDGRTLPAMVTMASPNGASLIVMFEGILDGCVGAMPILRDLNSGQYRNLMTGRPVDLAPSVVGWRSADEGGTGPDT